MNWKVCDFFLRMPIILVGTIFRQMLFSLSSKLGTHCDADEIQKVISRNKRPKKKCCHASSDREIWIESLVFLSCDLFRQYLHTNFFLAFVEWYSIHGGSGNFENIYARANCWSANRRHDDQGINKSYGDQILYTNKMCGAISKQTHQPQ